MTVSPVAPQYRAFGVGDRLRVVPPGTPGDRPGDVCIARGAFGSGEHETTASCLEAVLSLPEVAGATVLDLGCGTGILALAAVVLGAGRVVCIDHSMAAMATTRLNCRLNRAEDRIWLVGGSLQTIGAACFDLILANVHGDVLVSLAAELLARTRPGARLVLSGILWEHSYDVRTAFSRLGCGLLAHRMLDEYCTLVLEATTSGIPGRRGGTGSASRRPAGRAGPRAGRSRRPSGGCGRR